MELTIDGAALRDAIALCKAGIPSRANLAVLYGADLVANEFGLTITTTNLDTTVSAMVPAQVAAPGRSIVNCSQLAAAVKGKKGDRITLRAEGDKLAAVGAFATKLPQLDQAEWPKQPQIDAHGGCHLVPVNLLEKVLLAACTDEAVPVLCGVLFDEDAMVATDRYRLHRATVYGATFPKNLVPGYALAQAVKAAKKAKATEIMISFHTGTGAYQSYARIVAGGVSMLTRLIEGEFPNYKTLIPASPEHAVTFDKATMAAILTQVKGMKLDAITPIVFHPAEDAVEAVEATDTADAVEARPAKPHRVEVVISDTADFSAEIGGTVPFKVGFNPRFLADALSIDVSEIRLTDAVRPAVMSCGVAGGHLLHLLMPVRVG